MYNKICIFLLQLNVCFISSNFTFSLKKISFRQTSTGVRSDYMEIATYCLPPIGYVIEVATRNIELFSEGRLRLYQINIYASIQGRTH